MPTKRQTRFLEEVVEAARSAPVVKPRGRPVPENLTEEGRNQGLAVMHSAPRCRAKRRDGQPCRKPAMRGAKLCSTHGGRVEVPKHPANIRRFLSGEMYRSIQIQEEFMEGKSTWDEMTLREQRELMEALPTRVRNDSRRLYRAAIVWKLMDKLPLSEWRRRWTAIVGTTEYRNN